MSSSNQADLSQDADSVYKRFICYVLPQDPNCVKAIRLIKRNNTFDDATWVQDVRALPEKPGWLRGVPAVADTEQQRAYLGTEALQFIQQFKPKDPTAYDLGSGGAMNGDAGSAGFGHLHMDSLFSIEGDDGGDAQMPPAGGGNQRRQQRQQRAASQIEAMRLERQQQDQAMRSRIGHQRPDVHMHRA